MKNWFKVFILYFMLGFLLYANGLNNKFLMDDYAFLNNPVSSQLKFIFNQWNPFDNQALGVLDNNVENAGFYRPLALMVSIFTYATFKTSYWQYHLFNLFFFVLACSFIYLFIEKITANRPLALLAGLFYLIHAVNAIAVNYIPGNAFSLEVVCMLTTILLLWKSLEIKNDRIFYFLSLFFSVLSLFWHESGIMLPFYVSAVILLFRAGRFKDKIGYLLPYFLLGFSYLVFRLNFAGVNEDVLDKMRFSHLTIGQYLAGLFQAYAWYISKLFYPKGVVLQWATPVLHDNIILNVWGLFLLLVFSIFLFIKLSKQKICQLGLLFLLIGFAPVLLAAFREIEFGVMMEAQWFAFSSVGFFILVAYFCLFILERAKKTGAVLLFIMIFTWSSISHTSNLLWLNEEIYATYWTQQDPAFKQAFIYLGDAYQRRWDVKDAIKNYLIGLRGLSMDSESAVILNNIGVLAQREGNWKAAELDYREALKISPNYRVTYNNLGLVYLVQGQMERAAQNFEQALVLDPLYLKARTNLALISLKQGDYQKTIDLCLKNLSLVKDDRDSLYLLSVAMKLKSKR